VVNPDNVYDAQEILYGPELSTEMTRRGTEINPDKRITYQFIHIHFITINETEKVDKTEAPYSHIELN
jgi:hypothetical protein